MEDEARQEPAEAKMPRTEEMIGRQLRLLRLSRRWSQQEVADRMKAFGYNWRQSTIGKIEAAQRPLRLDELADLAVLFEVPAAQFLESEVPDDLQELRYEIAELTHKCDGLRELVKTADAQMMDAQYRYAELAAQLVRAEARLDLLRRWQPSAGEGGDDGGPAQP